MSRLARACLYATNGVRELFEGSRLVKVRFWCGARGASELVQESPAFCQVLRPEVGDDVDAGRQGEKRGLACVAKPSYVGAEHEERGSNLRRSLLRDDVGVCRFVGVVDGAVRGDA